MPVVMDSGLAASRRPGMTHYSRDLKNWANAFSVISET
jgi:hypothetical protein